MPMPERWLRWLDAWYDAKGSSPRPVQITALILSLAVVIAAAGFDEVAALSTLPLIVFGMALARARTWALFALCATLVALGHALWVGALPSWIAVAMIPALLAVCAILPWAFRFDGAATMLALALAVWMGLSIADLGVRAAARFTRVVAPRAAVDAPVNETDRQLIGTDVKPLVTTELFSLRKRVCRGKHPAVGRLTVVDVEDVLWPLPYGPRVEERPWPVFAEEASAIERALDDRQELLGQCYRWARYHGSRELAGTLQLRGEVSIWGSLRIKSRTFQPSKASTAHRARRARRLLVDCSDRVLEGIQLGSARAIATDFDVAVTFEPSEQQPDRPPRPPPSPLHVSKEVQQERHRCLQLTEPAFAFRQQLALEPIEVNDFDPEQAERQGDVVCRLIGPYAREYRVLSRDLLRRYLRYNMGTYRDCYRQQSHLRGKVMLLVTISTSGVVERVVVEQSTVGHAKLERCLSRAVAEVSFPPTSDPIKLAYTLQLDPTAARPLAVPERARVAALQVLAREQLAQGDGKAALRSYSALIRALPAAPRRCAWHLGLLKAARQVAPWGDYRVEIALRELRDGGSYPPDRKPAHCLDQAAAEIGEIAMQLHRDARLTTARSQTLRRAIHWYRLALEGWASPGRLHELRYHLAEALASVYGCRTAAPVFAEIVEQDPWGRYRPKAREALRACQ